MARKLERSTVETWLAIIVGIVAAAVPMSWYFEALLFTLAGAFFVDIVLHAHWSKGSPRWRKAATIIIGFLILGVLGAPSMVSRYREAKTRDDNLILSREALKTAVAQEPRVLVTNVGLAQLSKTDEMRLNVNFANQGQSAVLDIKPHMGIAATSAPLSRQQEDALFDQLENQTHPSLASSDLMEPGEGRVSTLPAEIEDKSSFSRHQLKTWMEAGRSVYLFVDLEYADPRDKTFWKTVSCQHFDFNVPKQYWPRMLPHKCFGHNGVFKVPPGSWQGKPVNSGALSLTRSDFMAPSGSTPASVH